MGELLRTQCKIFALFTVMIVNMEDGALNLGLVPWLMFVGYRTRQADDDNYAVNNRVCWIWECGDHLPAHQDGDHKTLKLITTFCGRIGKWSLSDMWRNAIFRFQYPRRQS